LKTKKLFEYLWGGVVALCAQLVSFLLRGHYKRKNIWIISEKKTEARDNGYYLFKYLREKRPELNAYYVIKAGSADEKKVAAYGNTIRYDSFRHCVYYYSAKIRACSQVHGVRPFEELSRLSSIRVFRRRDQHQIYLTHGIAKDYREAYDFRRMGYELMICGATPEYDYYKSTFRYPDKNIALTGICRYDGLSDEGRREKIILVMPTFRDWLRTADSSVDVAPPADMARFRESEFFAFYRDLLSDRALNDWAAENGYRIVFYLHYTFQPYCAAFEEVFRGKPNIVVANRKEYDVQKLLIASAFLITDYSSVCFDFAYMRKPVVYAQFDKKEYREKHYQEGWFVYERDGVGPILEDVPSVAEYTVARGKEGFAMDPLYQQRTDALFPYHDTDNSGRVYDAILRLDE